ncbi:MAG TPA: YihY/virulence factor BrkB family protein [Steroidobacteraceae bacterium]|nr:YihY/virulence factor BrkB family protein [Steroidobacteraceae bacterium]
MNSSSPTSNGTGPHAPSGDAGEDRGRSAEVPSEIPARGWRDILSRVLHRISEDNLTLVSAGIAFNAMFALFPALIVLVSIYGMFAAPGDVAAQVQPFYAMLPHDAATLIQNAFFNVASQPNSRLGVGAAVSMGVAIYSSAQGMAALGTATNIAYHETERRGFFKLLGIAIMFTVGGLVGFLLLIGLGIAVPYALGALPLGPVAVAVALAVRWALLWAFAVAALTIVYRYAPCREDARWRWITWGSVMAATLWLAGSVLFSLYVQNFGSYGKTYGALGGVMILLMWFYLGSFAVLLGAEINAEMEHQTAVDTTTGAPRPMGERGAYVADTLGASSGQHSRNENRKSANPSSDR